MAATRNESVTGQPGRWEGAGGFAIWALVGLLLTFTVLTGFSIGFLVAPFAVIAFAVASWRAAGWPEAAGVALGTGAALIVVGFLNLDYDPCSERGSERGTIKLDAGEEASCGGIDPVPWLIAGAALAAISVALYRAVRR